MPTIDINGTRLSYVDSGTGEAVVLLHAGIADARMWRHQVPDLAQDHRVVAYDLRGYGESDLPTGPFTHHDDLVALLDALGIDR